PPEPLSRILKKKKRCKRLRVLLNLALAILYLIMKLFNNKSGISRRSAIQSVLGLAGMGLMALPKSAYAKTPEPFRGYGEVKITRLETFLVKPRWLFLKIHTDAEMVGLREPLLQGRALTIKTAIKELEPYLLGKDPRHIVHHWQAIYRHAFYRGGPILTSAVSGVDQALWD